jgi:hypothetical protein
MKWLSLALIFAIFSCKSKSHVCLIDVTDILKNATGKLITLKDTSHRVTAIYDEGWDSLKGGAFIFYPNQFLKSYTFYQNRVPVYMESYDENGYLIGTKGSPMVDRVINDLGNDSAYVQVYFFSPLKTYQQLSIKINNNPAVNYTLQRDSIYSDMLSTTFGINTDSMNQINMYSKIKYLDNCDKIEHVLSDSIFLIKDPKNGLSPATTR